MLKQKEIDYLKELSDYMLETERVSVRKFQDFEELNEFENFEHLQKCINEKEFYLTTNYTHLHQDIFFPERIKTINKFYFKSIPILVAVLIAIIGIINGNFSYILLIPLYSVSQLLSANNILFKKYLMLFFLILVSLYLFWNVQFLVGTILISFIFNIFMFGNYRNNRAYFILNAAQTDEKIFVLYFYFKLFSIRSNTSNKMFFCRKDYNVL